MMVPFMDRDFFILGGGYALHVSSSCCLSPFWLLVLVEHILFFIRVIIIQVDLLINLQPLTVPCQVDSHVPCIGGSIFWFTHMFTPRWWSADQVCSHASFIGGSAFWFTHMLPPIDGWAHMPGLTCPCKVNGKVNHRGGGSA